MNEYSQAAESCLAQFAPRYPDRCGVISDEAQNAAAGIARTTDRLNRFGLIAVSVCGCRLGF
jgi:hypothetical protein